MPLVGNKFILMKKIISLLVSLIIIPISLLANGGGIKHYGVNSAGNPFFKNVPEVKILREEILIRPEGEHIYITVNYLFKSDTGHRELHYAFPVDVWCLRADWNENADKTSDTDSEILENIKQVQFICNGEILEYKTEKPKITDEEHEHNLKARVWYYTTLNIYQGVTQLTVKYRLQANENEESGGRYKYAQFFYDFKPAATFGDGIIKEFLLTVDCSDPVIKDASVYRFPFVNECNKYIYATTDFDLTKAEPLSLSFSYENEEVNWLLRKQGLDGVEIKAPSASKYPLSNLFDTDFSTAYVLNGDCFEIQLKDGQDINNISILNGYYKSEETYYNNSRIKKALVEFISESGSIMDTETIEFEDMPYKELNYSNFSEQLSNVFGMDYDYFEYFDENDNLIENWGKSKVRFKVTDVYKGNKYNDICISEMFVF